jgi:uncharacterized membrane protein
MFENRSSFGRVRVFLVVAFVVGIVAGTGVATFEDGLPGYTTLAVPLVLMTVAGLGGYLYYRHLKTAGVADERSERIQHRATTVSWGALVVSLSVLGTVLTFTDADVPMIPVVWALAVGSVVVQEAATEYYRRRM